MTIQFPNIEAWDSNRDAVTFPADNNGQRIRCAISWEALQDNFGGSQMPPLECFRSNRSAIEGKAGGLINKKRFEPDGSVLVRSSDGP